MTGSSNAGEPGMPQAGGVTCSSESNEANASAGTSDGPTTITHMEAEQTTQVVVAGIDSAATTPEPPHGAQEPKVVAASLHVPANAEDSAGGPPTMTDLPPAAAEAELPPLPVDFVELAQDAYFVHPAMRSDVSDAFFVAVAQMRPCGLTPDDRVGKYRQREEGFVGMCCKHCGGQPGTYMTALVSLVHPVSVVLAGRLRPCEAFVTSIDQLSG